MWVDDTLVTGNYLKELMSVSLEAEEAVLRVIVGIDADLVKLACVEILDQLDVESSAASGPKWVLIR